MKIGCCAELKYSDMLMDIGFEYIECPSIELKNCEEFSVKYVNYLLPRNLSIFSENDFPHILEYSRNIICLAKEKNISAITFGSGGSRRISKNTISIFEIERWEYFLLFLNNLAKENSIFILLEPLTRVECNFINRIDEAVYWIKKLDLFNFGITLDFYHFFKEHKELNEINNFKQYIKHAHFSGYNQSMPYNPDSNIVEFITLIKNLDCDISLEIVPFNKDVITTKFLDMINSI